MPGAWAGLLLCLIHVTLTPDVPVDIVHTDVVCAEPVLKTSENDHRARRLIHDSGVFVTRPDGVSFGLGGVPRHVGENQLVHD